MHHRNVAPHHLNAPLDACSDVLGADAAVGVELVALGGTAPTDVVVMNEARTLAACMVGMGVCVLGGWR